LNSKPLIIGNGMRTFKHTFSLQTQFKQGIYLSSFLTSFWPPVTMNPLDNTHYKMTRLHFPFHIAVGKFADTLCQHLIVKLTVVSTVQNT